MHLGSFKSHRHFQPMPKKAQQSIIPVEQIASHIYIIRKPKVMLDRELAELYGIPTGRLNEQVKRNSKRLPKDFSSYLLAFSPKPRQLRAREKIPSKNSRPDLGQIELI